MSRSREWRAGTHRRGDDPRAVPPHVRVPDAEACSPLAGLAGVESTAWGWTNHRTKDTSMLTGSQRSTPLTSAPSAPLMFPTLSAAQLARIAAHGVSRPVADGEVLIE